MRFLTNKSNQVSLFLSRKETLETVSGFGQFELLSSFFFQDFFFYQQKCTIAAAEAPPPLALAHYHHHSPSRPSRPLMRKDLKKYMR